MPAALPAPRRLRFRPRHRLGHAREFARVYQNKLQVTRGPITMHAVENGLDHHRLGLSIGRRVGSAVRRSRLKRHLREAFRLSMDDLARTPEGLGFDLVLSARAHEQMSLDRYKDALLSMAGDLAANAQRRAERGEKTP